MITWSISTKPCTIITWWSSFQWWTSLCWSYLLHDSRSTFRSQCSEAISAYARLVKFNPSISACAKLACTRCRWTLSLSHLIITWCLGTTNFGNGAYSGRTLIPWNFSKRSSSKATAELSKIRCIKDKHHMQSKICDMIWPSSSCAFDLHLQRTVMISIVTPWSPL